MRTNRQDAKDAKQKREKMTKIQSSHALPLVFSLILISFFSWCSWRLGGSIRSEVWA
jgi:hypothetical protein